MPAATLCPRWSTVVSALSEISVYVGRIRDFERGDWIVYLAWVGLIFGLVAASLALVAGGAINGVHFPDAAWLVPIGSLVFAVSIAVDTIGHRTVYKEEIAGAEGLVHGITILCGIGSCVLLCAAYADPDAFWIPAMVLTVLSLVYSLVDEAFHWRRYVRKHADRVEMWSHLGILAGHGTMMVGWWVWFFDGYRGVEETLRLLQL